MNIYSNFLSSSRIYSFVWAKYKPAILKLMVDSDGGAQQYQFSKHEIKSISPKEKGGHSFSLRIHKGVAVNDIRKSAIAKDLLFVLQQSKKALELADVSTYEIKLDRNFVLHITKEEEATPTATEEVAVAEAATELNETA